MSEEECKGSWTAETLHQHFTEVLAERDRALSAALAASDKRLDGMNEFRQSLRDQASTFASKIEVDNLRAMSGAYITRAEAWGFLIGCFAVAATVIAALTYFRGALVK